MRLIKDFSGLIFPKVCVCCEEILNSSERHLCLTCMIDLPKMYQLNSENPIMRIFHGKINIEKATSYLEFENGNKTQRIIHELKYRNNPDLARFMGKLMGAALKPFFDECKVDAIIPVPLHYTKKIKRGYNQAEMLAVGISDITGMEVLTEIIKRKKRTKSQTQKSRYDRWINVSSVFSIDSKKTKIPEHILLIDDVITTGATIEGCVQCLVDNFACKVTVVSLARAA